MSGGGRSVWPKGAVWRNRSFVSVWAAASVSVLGSQVSLLALPFVAVTTLHGSAFEVAAIGFAALSPMLIFGLPAGVWLDRIRR